MTNTKSWEEYFYSAAQLVTCAIAIRINGKAEFIGSAVYLAPGLFVTAKHVVTDPLTRVGAMKPIHENKKYSQYDADFETKDFIIEAIQLPRADMKIAQRWNIRWMNFSHDMDFAILTSDKTSGPITHIINSLPITSLNIHPLQKQSEIISYGFFGDKNTLNKSVSEKATRHHLKFEGRPGSILKLHFDVASIADPPVYELNNKIEHTMSGGPVCNGEGSVIAINSAAIDPETPGETNRTIATLFIRNMFMKFNCLKNKVLITTSLYELAQKGYIRVIGYQHLSQTDEHIIWSPNSECEYCNGLLNEKILP